MSALAAAVLMLITGSHAPRVALLDLSPRAEVSPRSFAIVRNAMRDELRARGVDVVVSTATYESLQRHDNLADYVVEITNVQHEGGDGPVRGVIGAGPAGVEVSTMRGTAQAEMRLFDGRTLELIDSYALESDSSGLAPTAIGVGNREVFASVLVLPIFEQAYARNAARKVGRDAARRIAEHIARQ